MNSPTGEGVPFSTRDGRALVFVSKGDLLGTNSNNRDQVYLYREGKPFVCVSCADDGLSRTNARVSPGRSSAAMDEPGRYANSLSEDGSIVAFETGDAVLPGDHDGRRDVYLWNEGRVSLLTPSPADDNAYLLGMSSDGRDVFIATTSSLLPADGDGGDEDIYDVRVGGGFLAEEAEIQTKCTGEACQPPGSMAPGAQQPASELVAGPVTTKQRKPVRKTGRCAPKKGQENKGKRRAKARKSIKHRRNGCTVHRTVRTNHGGAK